MMRRRKIVIGTVACAFAVSILLLAAILIAPKVVDSETVKAKVRSELLKVAAGTVSHCLRFGRDDEKNRRETDKPHSWEEGETKRWQIIPRLQIPPNKYH
ncbi:MAG: hypothetical protein PVG44_13245 [Desulfobacterales bacterium]|jgi:hypothetical protein